MSISQVLFYIISAALLTFGFLSVTTRQIFRSAIYLLFSLIGIAAIYFMMEYEFIAAVQIVVYVGGIVVLLIFAIFLTQKAGDDMPLPIKKREWFAFITVLFGFAFAILLLSKENFKRSGALPIDPSVENIGLQMLDPVNHGFLLPFEVISLLLLVGMIGAIVIALKIKVPESES